MTIMSQKPYDTKIIPRESFREMIAQKKVIRTSAGRGGIIHEVKRLLEQNAMTLDAIAGLLKIDRKTAYNAINHLRQRYSLKITRYYNPRDRDYYYYLEDKE